MDSLIWEELISIEDGPSRCWIQRIIFVGPNVTILIGRYSVSILGMIQFRFVGRLEPEIWTTRVNGIWNRNNKRNYFSRVHGNIVMDGSRESGVATKTPPTLTLLPESNLDRPDAPNEMAPRTIDIKSGCKMFWSVGLSFGVGVLLFVSLSLRVQYEMRDCFPSDSRWSIGFYEFKRVWWVVSRGLDLENSLIDLNVVTCHL